MRRPFTSAQAAAQGISADALRWGVRTGRFTRIARGVYVDGADAPTQLERALALLVVTGGVACGSLAGHLHGLDSVKLEPPFATVPAAARLCRFGVRYRDLDDRQVITVQGYRCTSGVQTLLDLAASQDDRTWEQMLEAALRRRIATVDDLLAAAERVRPARLAGVARVRRVLARRPSGAPPTESLLETMMVQLIGDDAWLPIPVRQVEVRDEWQRFVARVDLAWPQLGVFIELDGEHHKDQSRYDARRETAVVAATGWLPARFTWYEVVRNPKATARRLRQIVEIAQRKAG